MPRSTPSRVAPGVDRLGDDVVNFYLVEEADGLVLVDAGLPAHLGQLREHLAAAGRSPADIRAVLLTHGHPDHTGLARTLQQAGADIWVHEQDAAILRDGPRSALRHAKPERSMQRYLLRRPAAIATPLHLARKGAFTAPAVPGVRVFDTDRRLDQVPGRPQTVALPGHTQGSTGYLFPERGLLFTGDALVTHDGLTGHAGPTLVCRGFTHDTPTALASLDRIDALPSGTVLLPGHGEPVTGDPHAATGQARAAGQH
ncbi:MBL fold metallo-hydrolase [Streptomyces cyaneofuscatus]|uniref:MBL fold metallo-hydrolase n=1 Tax=Streptomyces cyaneofuscatus TaxID=66883 RepID=UPI0013DC5691|nr:MBL fold metallo-hydrolase [Streptomyces cyaneofuscatus]NDZ67686.1 MBL fold metallo-hydrolase [Streptomyces cyaneofuscatus]